MKPLRLISADEARRILLEVPAVARETTPLGEAAGRVLAAPLVAPHDLPPERRAGMDGYAVRAADVQHASAPGGAVLRVIGAVAAGQVFAGAVGTGQAVSIATGAVVPNGADAVVMVELTVPVADAAAADVGGYVAPGRDVRVTAPVAAGAHVVQPGEDLRAGIEILAAGRRLRALDLAALAAFGVVTVPVFRRPRIAVLSTGSELCPPDQTPRPGQIRESNQLVLGAQVEAAGAVAVRAGIVADDLAVLRATVARLLADHDGVILSGGSSVGPKDLTGPVLAALGPPGILFHGIDIRPGKPTVFARAQDKPLVGMPGYPTSSLVVFEAFIRPMLARLGGETVVDAWPASTRARLACAYTKPASREDYLRVRLATRDGDVWADVVPGGSAAISNVLFADGLARVPSGVEHLDQGALVDVRRFS